ncbi:MAG: polymer-forming cytoskeletal protein [Chlamydiota bacterium]|nr:polymer-forming cytoskeletal protein [Chlamydiota bacterium]
MKPSWTKAVKPLRAQGHTVNIHCPSCQHLQSASNTAVSIFCKSCQNLIRIQEVLHPQTDNEEKHPDKHSVECFRCHSINQVFKKSQAFLCNKCGYRNDMQDYTVKSVLSQNIQTRGNLSVGPNATILNSTSQVSRAHVRGKYIGTLEAAHIELKKDSHFDGNIIAQVLHLELPLEISVRKKFEVEHLLIEGPFYGKLVTNGIIELGKNAQFYGEISAQKLIIHDSAIFIGTATVGKHETRLVSEKTDQTHASVQQKDVEHSPLAPITKRLEQQEPVVETSASNHTSSEDNQKTVPLENPPDNQIIDESNHIDPTSEDQTPEAPSIKSSKDPIRKKSQRRSSKKSPSTSTSIKKRQANNADNTSKPKENTQSI